MLHCFQAHAHKQAFRRRCFARCLAGAAWDGPDTAFVSLPGEVPLRPALRSRCRMGLQHCCGWCLTPAAYSQLLPGPREATPFAMRCAAGCACVATNNLMMLPAVENQSSAVRELEVIEEGHPKAAYAADHLRPIDWQVGCPAGPQSRSCPVRARVAPPPTPPTPPPPPPPPPVIPHHLACPAPLLPPPRLPPAHLAPNLP